jgi:hypothetical protein
VPSKRAISRVGLNRLLGLHQQRIYLDGQHVKKIDQYLKSAVDEGGGDDKIKVYKTADEQKLGGAGPSAVPGQLSPGPGDDYGY